MDIIAFLSRVGMNQSQLSRKLGVVSQNVSNWCKGKGAPSYDVCKKLLELGITVEELFGVEYKHYPKEFIDKAFSDPDEEQRKFQAGVQQALLDLLNRANSGQQSETRPKDQPPLK